MLCDMLWVVLFTSLLLQSPAANTRFWRAVWLSSAILDKTCTAVTVGRFVQKFIGA